MRQLYLHHPTLQGPVKVRTLDRAMRFAEKRALHGAVVNHHPHR